MVSSFPAASSKFCDFFPFQSLVYHMINIAQTLKKKLEVMKNMTYTYM